MCLLAFSWDPNGDTRLTLAGNRDEFYARPSVPAAWWANDPDIWAGQDLEGGGTWLGITRGGRFAVVTNVREPQGGRTDLRSRGLLVSTFLRGLATPMAYLQEVADIADEYRGFNLLVGTLYDSEPTLAYYSNRTQAAPVALTPGVYGMSNAALDSPWPKVVALTSSVAWLKAAHSPLEAYLRPLEDRRIAPDPELPSTGVTLARERMLSAAFIVSPDYGTRAQTVVLAHAGGQVELLERSFDNAEQAATLAPASIHSDRFTVG